MQGEIPGYYYDPEKRKYFKVERSQTAPSSVVWSSDAVKRRRIQDAATEEARRRAFLVRNHIKRHALRRDIVSSHLLTREIDGLPFRSRGRGLTEGRVVDDEDVASAAWAGGVVEKGRIPFAPSFASNRSVNMGCFHVSGEDAKMGLGVAYASLDEETLVGSYIPTDGNDKISFSKDAPSTSGKSLSFFTEMIRCPQMSSINYHQPSHKIMLTSRRPDHSCGLYFFSPQLSEENEDRPHWLLGETNHYQRVSIRHRLRDEWLVHRSTAAPPSSDLLCVIATNAGILRVRSNETMAWIGTPAAATSAAGQKEPVVPHEVFDQDFCQGNHNVLFAGGRQKRLWVTDLRAPETEWGFVRCESSVCHVRSLNEWQVCVAGLENMMCVYDMRFAPKYKGHAVESSPYGRPRVGPKSLLTFPSYKNEAHVHTGWDISRDLGVAAAAHDDGTVKLFSLRSGQVLKTPASKNGLSRINGDTPLRSLMFQTMPRESLPSLWIGEGSSLRKYSFGTLHMEDEA